MIIKVDGVILEVTENVREGVGTVSATGSAGGAVGARPMFHDFVVFVGWEQSLRKQGTIGCDGGLLQRPSRV